MKENETSKIKSIKNFFLSFLLTLSYLYLLSRSLNLIAENFDSRKTLIQGILLLIGWGGFFLPLILLALLMRKQKKIAVAWGIISVYIAIAGFIVLTMGI